MHPAYLSLNAIISSFLHRPNHCEPLAVPSVASSNFRETWSHDAGLTLSTMSNPFSRDTLQNMHFFSIELEDIGLSESMLGKRSLRWPDKPKHCRTLSSMTAVTVDSRVLCKVFSGVSELTS